MSNRLNAHDLCLTFGGLEVTRNVSLSLPPGARTALIGPNGAGKTTLVNLLSGVLEPASGDVRLAGTSIIRKTQAARVRLGLARTFQISRLFKDLTVFENLEVAVLQKHRVGMRWWRSRELARRVTSDVNETLDLLGLHQNAGRIVGHLALGEQRLVEIALPLALKPNVLLLDEPAAGVPQSESSRIMHAIGTLPKDLAVLFIEHDMDLVFRFATRIIVLAAGKVIAEGSPQEISVNEQVKQVYFGREGHAHGRH